MIIAIGNAPSSGSTLLADLQPIIKIGFDLSRSAAFAYRVFAGLWA
jgi:hypothetical protein